MEVIIINSRFKFFLKCLIFLGAYFSLNFLFGNNYKIITEIKIEELYEITDVKGSNQFFFIAQRTSSNIIKLNSSGQLLKIIGGKGKGPGEFDSIKEISIINNQLIVKDDNLRRITLLTYEGEYVHSFNIDVTGNMNIGDNVIYINNPVTFIKSDYSNKISEYDLKGKKITTYLNNDYNGGEINKALFYNSCYLFVNNEKFYCFNKFQRVINVYNANSGQKIQTKKWDTKFSVEIPKMNNSQHISYYNNPAFVSMIKYKECFYCVYFNEDDQNLTRIAKFASDLSSHEDIAINGIFPYIFILDKKIHLLSEDFILIQLLNE